MIAAAANARAAAAPRRRTFAVLELMRPKGCAGAACYVLLSAWASGAQAAALGTLVAALVVALIVGAAFTFNDVQDVHTDSLIKPSRPLPSRRISPRAACWAAAALAASALIGAATLGSALFAFAVVYVAASALYSTHLKSTVLAGNVTMAVLIGSIPIYTGVALGEINAKLVVIAAMMFTFSLAQEILFTLEDRDGDREAGLTTTATRFAPATSLRLFQLTALIFAAASLLPPLLGLSTSAYLYAALVCTVIPTLVAALRLPPDADAAALGRAADTMGTIWWTSIVPLLLMR
jgi:geranylgeranylglycerol-phosphate geranylgeranyltransferase